MVELISVISKKNKVSAVGRERVDGLDGWRTGSLEMESESVGVLK
jgi:hypothetical protein